MLIPALLIGGLLLMAGGAGKKRRHAPTPAPTRQPSAEEAEAITFCEMEGGTATVMQTPEGDTFFMCTFPDGRMVEALSFHRGEAAPECPIDMVYDAESETCIPLHECPPGAEWDEDAGGCVTVGEAWPPHPDDPNFQICMGDLLAAWAPYTDTHYNLGPAVAENLYLIMRNAVEESWAGYKTPEALADFGMVHVAPECDWYAMRQYVRDYVEEVGMPPGSPEDTARADEVYASVLALAKEAMADAEIPPDFQEGEGQHGLDQGVNPDQGGVYPKCPPNYFYDAVHDVCCPDGFYWNDEEQMCRPMGYGGLASNAALRQTGYSGGYAGGCGGRRGHCGVRPR